MAPVWLGDAETKPAPGTLARIQSLVNTREIPNGADRLADPIEAQRWLVAHGLIAAGARATRADVDLVCDVREAFRAVLMRNTGGPEPDDRQRAVLQTLADTARARVVLAPDGQVQLTAAGDGVRDRLLELLLAMHEAQRDDSWRRLKACANPDCRWAFYDRSRNHGGTWCVMSGCGNKLKNREFRARRRAGGANGGLGAGGAS